MDRQHPQCLHLQELHFTSPIHAEQPIHAVGAVSTAGHHGGTTSAPCLPTPVLTYVALHKPVDVPLPPPATFNHCLGQTQAPVEFAFSCLKGLWSTLTTTSISPPGYHHILAMAASGTPEWLPNPLASGVQGQQGHCEVLALLQAVLAPCPDVAWASSGSGPRLVGSVVVDLGQGAPGCWRKHKTSSQAQGNPASGWQVTARGQVGLRLRAK